MARNTYDITKHAGEVLRCLIQKHYPSQEAFARNFGIEIRTLSRYINQGITKVTTLQELSDFFDVPLIFFLDEPS